MPSRAAWGVTGSISSEWVKKNNNHNNILSQTYAGPHWGCHTLVMSQFLSVMLRLGLVTQHHKYAFRVILNKRQFEGEVTLAIFRHRYFKAFRPSSGVQQLQVDQKSIKSVKILTSYLESIAGNQWKQPAKFFLYNRDTKAWPCQDLLQSLWRSPVKGISYN